MVSQLVVQDLCVLEGMFADVLIPLDLFSQGFDSVVTKIKGHAKEAEILADIQAVYASRPGLAMVDSRKGITNLHVPNDVIIDASMPNVVRDSGGMWNKDDKLEDVLCMIPDRCYAGIYDEILKFCHQNGEFNVSTMGNVSNVGLMAQKAEEYGSHDKTFILEEAGSVRVVDDAGKEIFTHTVEKGDIWRMAQTRDAPIQDWIRLSVARMRATGSEGIFWLDKARGHDASIIAKIEKYIGNHDTKGLKWSIMPPREAMAKTCANSRAGVDTISMTGNVLRDYLTDLFPILELGTSAKMLSIVPLLNGGGLYETGAGGSAPKHVQQFVKEGHLRWDSLGEYLATAVSLEDLGTNKGDAKASLLGRTLNKAIGKLLDNRKSPSRKVNELDNRGSNFYVAFFWAQELVNQTEDVAISEHFKPLAAQLVANEAKIVKELIDCQGHSKKNCH
jgi:isocitrate dehydrogenase